MKYIITRKELLAPNGFFGNTDRCHLISQELQDGPYKGLQISEVLRKDISYLAALFEAEVYLPGSTGKSYLNDAMADREYTSRIGRMHDRTRVIDPDRYVDNA